MQAPHEVMAKLPELNEGQLNACKYDWVDGKAAFFPCLDGRCFPTEEQKQYSEVLIWELNEQLSFNGRWRVVMRSPVKSQWDEISRTFRAYMPKVIEMQFLDADDDPQFVVSLEQTLAQLLDWGFIPVLELAEAAYTEHKAMMAAIDVKDDQTIKAAKGEAASNEIEQYAID